MHPDQAAQIAIQDLRSRGLHAPRPAGRGPSSSIGSTLLHAYFGALRWYVEDGRAPAGEGAAVWHLPRARVTVHAKKPADEALAPLGLGLGVEL